jgi:hypothetical protein
VGVDVYSRCATTEEKDDDDDDEHEPDDVTHEPSGEDRQLPPTLDRRGQCPRNKLLADIETAAMSKKLGVSTLRKGTLTSSLHQERLVVIRMHSHRLDGDFNTRFGIGSGLSIRVV